MYLLLEFLRYLPFKIFTFPKIFSGQYSTVYHCVHRGSGEEFAAKICPKRRHGIDRTTELLHDVAICSLLRHVINVVKLVEVFNAKNEIIQVMEL